MVLDAPPPRYPNRRIRPGDPYGDAAVLPVAVPHGRVTVYGYRIGPLAYVTDAKGIPESARELFRGVKVLVINALFRTDTADYFLAADTLRGLIERGADVNAVNDEGATALMWALPDLEKTKLLVEAGADVNARSALGEIPLRKFGADGKASSGEVSYALDLDGSDVPSGIYALSAGGTGQGLLLQTTGSRLTAIQSLSCGRNSNSACGANATRLTIPSTIPSSCASVCPLQPTRATSRASLPVWLPGWP